MAIYLPIAEIPVNIFLLLGLGGLGGLLAGMFGIGGGFIITPFLIFIGIPPPVAVATSANQIIASSVSGFLAHWYRNNVDLRMGIFMLIGGLIGAELGVRLFTILNEIGQIDLVISVSYVVFLGSIGTFMAIESFKTIKRKKNGESDEEMNLKVSWIGKINLPFKIYFPKSELQVSAILPVGIGLLAGVLVSLIGIGGGFIMIPAMIYLLGMPTSLVVGTSLFQIIFTTSLVTILHSINTQTVDIVLAFLLIVGGVIGAQVGTVMGLKLPAEKLRGLLAILIIAICIELARGLFLTPDDLFTVTEIVK